jgi:drug/metabolite transporter (DMT)-like permease
MLYLLVKCEAKSPEERDWRTSDILLFLLLAVVGVFSGQVLITWGTRMSLASNAALLMLTLPVATAFLGVYFPARKNDSIRWISFGLSVIGVLMCSGIDFRTLNFGKGFYY